MRFVPVKVYCSSFTSSENISSKMSLRGNFLNQLGRNFDEKAGSVAVRVALAFATTRIS